MRLIDVEAFLKFDAGKAVSDAQLLVEFNGPKLAKAAYAILSHCWEEFKDEVHYTEMQNLTKMDIAARDEIRRRSGYRKICQSCMQAHLDRLCWLWVDTCCIDNRSSAELSEAINSMYVWYANSDSCYAFLHDIDTNALPTEPDNNIFKFNGRPKWFSRGWTLQELIAPEDVHFFNRNWKYMTSKQDSAYSLSVITRIPVGVLQKGLSWSYPYPSVAQIMAWAADRTTTREEDRAYSLLGLFGVHMPMLYGEGRHAFLRLQLEVIRIIDDQSIFAWGWTREAGSASGFLANDPSHFRDCSDVVRIAPTTSHLHGYFPTEQISGLISGEEQFQTFSVTNRGIQIWLPLKREGCCGDSEFFSAILACCVAGGTNPITITMEQFGTTCARYFGPLPVVENQTVSVDYKPVLLPYRTNINLNIRGPSSKRVSNFARKYHAQR
ncbi:hypothetical protein EDC04DRAFT_1081076 [Pisolithus marmoratus]|nr:hypothetical protein EDC04DRAFT_1081076 [Pisolithus marmoratus]